ncbi:phage baseplate upper protein [Enterococcus sp. DIV0210g]|uniref:phage baseplate upper protein n=1 Tax=Enterococcus sp. DIV0210g TaxID=2774656 RepID=UPI003D2FFED3
MAIKHEITLSTTEPNNEIGLLKIRQSDEETQTLVVQITENGLPKSYAGLEVFFCAKLGQTAGLGIIEQKLKPNEMTSPGTGQLKYTLRDEDWQQLGRQTAYFSFRKMKNAHEWTEQFSTRDFTYNVTKNVFSEGVKEVKKDGSTYVWTIEDLIRLFKEYIQSGKNDWEEFIEQNKEIIENVDPGGKVLTELIEARKPFGEEAYPNLGKRLDADYSKLSNLIILSNTHASARRLGRFYRKSNEIPSNNQAFCALNSNIVVQYMQNDGDRDKQYGSLVKFDINTGQILLENVIKGYHGNSMTYCKKDGYIYFCPSEDSTTVDRTQQFKLYKIDTATLEVTDEFDFSDKTTLSILHSVGYDDVSESFFVANNKIIECYGYDLEFKFKVNLESLLGYEPTYGQGIQVNNGVLYYIGGRKSQIWTFKINVKKEKLEYMTTYEFDVYQENFYALGEIEGIGFNDVDGLIYLSTQARLSTFGGLSQYFVTNNNFSHPSSGSGVVKLPHYSTASSAIFYGNNTGYNPDGTQNNPFPTLLECGLSITSPYLSKREINFLNDGREDTLALFDAHNVTIVTNGYKIRAAVLVSCTNIYAHQLDCVYFTGYNNNAFYAYHSSFRINNLTTSDNGLLYPNFIERCDCVIANITAKTFVKNSSITMPTESELLLKENMMARLSGLKRLGEINNITDFGTILSQDFSYYNKIAVDLTIVADKTIYMSADAIRKSSTDLSMIGLASGTTYMCILHLVSSVPTNSTIDLYKLTAGNWTKITIVSFELTVRLSDI